jgi:3-hydroxyacyl-[acyl-carrier-protein] dehydratase
MAQAGALLVYVSEPFDPAVHVMYYLGLDKVKFRNTVAPGDQMDIVVDVLEHRAGIWRFRAEATVEGTLCAQAELMASVVDRA